MLSLSGYDMRTVTAIRAYMHVIGHHTLLHSTLYHGYTVNSEECDPRTCDLIIYPCYTEQVGQQSYYCRINDSTISSVYHKMKKKQQKKIRPR